MQKSTYKYLGSLLAGLILTALAHAQAQDPPAFGDNVTDLVPLDGGLSILLGAGIALGAKKAYQYSKERKG
jgi:hypothetical protein